MSGLNGQHSGRAGMLSGVAAAIAGMTLNWASSPGNLLPPGFSLTRSGTNATYFDSAGLLATAGANVARGTYRYNGSAWVFDGTMIEQEAANLLSYTNDLSSWSVFGGTGAATQNAPGLSGPTSGWTTTDTSAAAARLYYIQTASLAAGTRTASFYVQKTTGAQASYPVLTIEQTGGALRLSAVTIDTSNGVATPWTAYTGYTVNTTTATIRNFSADLWAVTLTTTSVGTTAHQVTWVPAGTTNATQSTGVLDPAAQGSAGVTAFQYEDGAAATSYIDNPSTGTVPRAADVVTATTSGLLVNGQGFAAMRGRVIVFSGANSYLTTYTGTEGVPIYQDINGMAIFDGTGVRNWNATPPATAPLPGSIFSIATTWGGALCNGAYNGTLGTPQTFDGSMNLGTTLRIGDRASGGEAISMVLQSMRLGVQTVNNSRLANPFA